MARKRYKPEEMVSLLRQAEVLHGQGLSMADAIRQLGISEVTSYRWRKEYAGMSGDQLRRLKELEKESERLRRAVSDLTLDKQILKEAAGRPSNPNCLVSGDNFHLVDHELAFPRTAGLLNWQPPSRPGALQRLDAVEGHIFASGLKRHRLDFDHIRAVWSAISDERLSEYRDAIPLEWMEALPAVDEALGRVRDARDNFDGVIAEVERVLQ